MYQVTQEILDARTQVRYAALYTDGKLETSGKAGVAGASVGESDKYEELLVNPAVLTLVTQRGDMDFGGAFRSDSLRKFLSVGKAGSRRTPVGFDRGQRGSGSYRRVPCADLTAAGFVVAEK